MADLTHREIQILQMLIRGVDGSRTDHALATAMHLEVGTIRTHFIHMRAKTQTRDKVGLVLWYLEQKGWLGGASS